MSKLHSVMGSGADCPPGRDAFPSTIRRVSLAAKNGFLGRLISIEITPP
jgi:hypothetical protein